MSTVAMTSELLDELARRGIHVWVEGGQLRYRAPQGALSDELKGRIVERKAALVELLSQAQADAGGADAPPLRRLGHDGRREPSFAQERLWFMDRFEPGSAAYSIYDALDVFGAFDEGALRRSLDEIVRRHEALRTTFVAQDGRPVQVVAPAGGVALALEDLRAFDEAAREAELQRRVASEVQKPFDLAAGPLLRVCLFRLADEHHVLLLNLHHIISDGWSTGVLVGEIAALYAAFSEGRPSPLPELAVQYGDYAAWQRESLAGEAGEREASFWRAALADAPTHLDLPTDQPRPAVRGSAGDSLRFTLPAATVQALRAWAQRAGATPYMVVLAAFAAVLRRWSGQTDLVIGSAVAGRVRLELEGLVGLFVNTLPLRVDLSDRPAFATLVERVKHTALDAQAHQQLPLERIVEALAIPRDTSRTPLFQAALTFLNAPAGELRAPGVRLARRAIASRSSKFDLTLQVLDGDTEIVCELEYSTELFERATAARLAEHFQRLLGAGVTRPETPVEALPLLDEAERAQLLAWAGQPGAHPREAGLAELFEEQAHRRPGAVAVSFDGLTLTYAQLNRRANRLAQRLIQMGVGPGARVALVLARSLELIVGLVGITKAGAAYVPLDPADPQPRLVQILEETGCLVIVSDGATASTLPADARLLIDLGREEAELGGESEDDPPRRAGAADEAYVMFTSGSTGRPKGIRVPQRGIVRLVKNDGYVRFGEDEVFLQLAPVSFDAATFEVWGALLNGGRLAIYPKEPISLPRLRDVLQRERVTTLWLTAGLFHMVVQEDVQALAPLRQLLAGGDVLDPERVRHVLATLPGLRFVNGYGPTENTTFTACHVLHDAAQVRAPLPIGRPIAGTRAYVVEAGGDLAPVGVPGELWTGGDGVAAGYLERPELTAERFVRDPFVSDPAARAYRTGDRVRWRADGTLEFLGRMDQQVKIRGYRVEPGEIEAALRSVPGVTEAAVVLHEQKDDKRLVAFVVGGGDLEALRRELRGRLPEYMVPGQFVKTEELPLNANGKLDRRALLALVRTAGGDEPGADERVTTTQEVLAELWRSVLGLERVGLHDDFFVLGGHSLLATQLMSRVSASFRVELPLKALFETPTVAGLGARIDLALAAGQVSAMPPLERVSRDQVLPLSHFQESLWLFESLTDLESGQSAYTTCRSGRVRGRLDTAAVEGVVNDLLQRHEILRTGYETVNGQPRQLVLPHVPVSVPVEDLTHLSPEEREREAERISNEEAGRPMNIAKGHVLRARVLRLGPEDHVFILAIHHIAYDLWSGGVLLGEIERFYLERTTGQPNGLPELPVQYADYATWQRRFFDGWALERDLAYWKRQLAGLSIMPLQLPYDYPRPRVEQFACGMHDFAIDSDLSRSVLELARQEGVTDFMMMMAIFQALLSRWTGQDDVVASTAVTNRHRVELENLLGFFDNLVVLRTDAGGRPTFREFLKRVRDVALEAYAHRHLAFERVVQELQPERLGTRVPYAQVAFVYMLNYPAMEREVAGLKVVPYNLNVVRAKADLALAMVPRKGRLVTAIEYNREMLAPDTIERFARHYQRLVAAVVKNPDRPIDDYELMDDEERRLVTVDWNRTELPLHEAPSVHATIEHQARVRPDAPAIESIDGSIATFGRLNACGNQLGRRLRELGVGRDSVVAVYVERSAMEVAAMLGTMKAGGAYVPLDSAWPPDRLAFVVQDSGARAVLTSRARLESLPPVDVPVMVLDDPAVAADLGSLPEHDLAPLAGPGDLVYVIYTSGSTGLPKGVAVEHRNLLNMVAWHRQMSAIDHHDRISYVAGQAFDVSVWELWTHLPWGACVIIPREEWRTSVEALRDYIVDKRITVAFAPPPLTNMLMGMHFKAKPALRHLYTGGDRLLAPPRPTTPFALVNCYGPTETTICSTAIIVPPAERAQRLPSIGGPLANTQIYVLDAQLRPVPQGVPGEICIAGAGLARGYLNRPELSAEKFVPDAFSATPGARMYRTGDLGRWLPDGTLDFLGRLDRQVKVRGFRVELGEIETALRAMDGVAEAVVLPRGEETAMRLAAYLVPQPGARVATATELRAFLKQRLPEYMVPSAFVPLAELPLTPNGKVDRNALPAPEDVPEAMAEDGGVSAPPRDEVELRLLALWERVLGARQLGIHDDFFARGGHSLHAVQLLSGVKAEFARELSPAALFLAPNVAAMAALLRDSERGGAAVLVPLNTGGEKPPLFLVHPVGGHIVCYVELSRKLGPEQPLYAFQAVPETQSIRTFEGLAARYVEELRRVQPEGPYHVGGWSLGGVIAFEMARQLVAAGQSVAQVLLIDSLPGSTLPQPQGSREEWLFRLLIDDMQGWAGASLGLEPADLAALPEGAWAEPLLEALRKHGVMPEGFGVDELRALVSTYARNVLAYVDYVPGAYAGRVLLATALDSERALRVDGGDAPAMWAAVTQGVEHLSLDTDHYGIVKGQPAQLLAEWLKVRLGEAALASSGARGGVGRHD